MKISIQQEDITSYIEFEDYNIHEFANHLRNLLHTVWLPCQVNEIMPTEESLSDEFAKVRKEAYDEGFEEGRAADKKLAETIFEEGRAKGFEEGIEVGKAKGYEEGIDEAISHVEGYAERKANNAKPAETTDDLRDCIREGKDNAEKSNILCKQDRSNIL